MKDKNRIINEMVVNAADVMEAKADYLGLVAAQFEEKDIERAEQWRKDIPQIMQAVELMRKLSGCWA